MELLCGCIRCTCKSTCIQSVSTGIYEGKHHEVVDQDVSDPVNKVKTFFRSDKAHKIAKRDKIWTQCDLDSQGHTWCLICSTY